MFFPEPYWSLLSQVARPSRYSGSEWRGYPVPDWDGQEGRRLRVCLAFPDVYEIGMSYYGFQLIASLIRALGCLVDRAYCPWVDMEALLRARNLPLLSVEQRRPLCEFDVLAFTLQHETGYTNVLTMLNLAGDVSLRSQDRKENAPLVIAGGHGSLVPEPLSPFIDLFCIGEAEVLLPPLLELLTGTKGERRSSRLAACAKLRGIYVPSLYSTDETGSPVSNKLFPFPIERQILQNLDDALIPEDIAVPSVSVVHDRAALELFRGCTRGCRFCQAGMICRPVRERSVEAVMEAVPRLLDRSGYDELGLLSLASCDYSGIERLIDGLTEPLTERRARLSLPSLRIDGFSVGLAGRLQKLRRGGLTFAPEAGTQRLRDVINKGVTEAAIEACLKEAFSLGWDRVKLYFMMGLPTEAEEDLDGIIALARRALKLGRSLGRKRTAVSVSVAGFVPKAHTPFQWERQNAMEELREKGHYLKRQVRERAITLSYHEPEQTFLEGVLSRGDRRTANVIERAWRQGARFDSWTETFNLQNWLDAFEYCGLDPVAFTREREEAEVLPWDHIRVGVTKTFLLRERHKAYVAGGAELTPDCRWGHCSGCGLNCFASEGKA